MKKIKSEKQINRPELRFTRIETLKKTISHLKKLDEESLCLRGESRKIKLKPIKKCPVCSS
jgi:hypothetical protein